MPNRAFNTSSEPDFRVISFQPQHGERFGSARKYQRRKTHQKSRNGCLTCKVKRVKVCNLPPFHKPTPHQYSKLTIPAKKKCDEARPSCSRCRRNSAWCSYTTDDSDSPSPSDQELSIVLGCKVKRMGSLASSPAIHGFDPNDAQNPYGTPRIVLMHHFQYLFPDLQMLENGGVDPILSLGLCRPFLLDSILAVSASHLRSESISKSSHRVAEHFQQALAIKNFQGALEGPLDQQTADALLLTAMFLNLLSFSVVEDDDVEKSWVFSNHPDRLGWLSLSLGIKPLLYATESFRQNTILGWMFDTSDDEAKTVRGEWEYLTLRDVPSHWLELVGLRRDSDPDVPLFEPVRQLSETDRLEPKPEYFFLYVNMIGSLDFAFRDKLERRDETALWLMGYWLGLICRYDFWWLRKRAWRDYRAVVIWLDRCGLRERPGSEGAMWTKLLDDLDAAPYWKGLWSFGSRVSEEC